MQKLSNYAAILKNRIAIRLRKSGYSIPNKAKKVINNAPLFDEVISHIDAAGLDCSLFYGTLLEYIRNNGQIYFADDFDFAVTDRYCAQSLLKLAEAPGWEPKGYMHADGDPIQISFLYKGVGIDFSLLSTRDKSIEHVYPDFRNTHAKIYFSPSGQLKRYDRAYSLSLKKDILPGTKISKHVCLLNNAGEVLTQIYDEEWRIEKRENYIDYGNYNFFMTTMTLVTRERMKINEILLALDI